MGWHFLWHGNGYGPYETENVARREFMKIHGHLPNSIVYPVYGMAEVVDRKLMAFDRMRPPVEDEAECGVWSI